MILSATIGLMAERTFESDTVEEFYNSCHGPNGRFCGTGAKGKGISRVPMSSAARASNAAIRGTSAKMRKKAAAKNTKDQGAKATMTKQAGKVKAAAKYKDYGSGKTDPAALNLTQKYGTRKAGGTVRTSTSGGKKTTTPSNVKYKPDNAGSGKTDAGALHLTKRFGTRRGSVKPTASNVKYKPDNAGSGKTDAEVLRLTKKYGTRRA